MQNTNDLLKKIIPLLPIITLALFLYIANPSGTVTEQELTIRLDIFIHTEEPITIEPTYRQFTITAYDNTPHSQGKWVDQTATGYSLKGKSRTDAMCIAVDPKVIPLNSKVELIFDAPYEHFNGVYTALDVGGLIKGTLVDIFLGDGVSRKEVFNFGRRKVKLRIL